MAIAFQIGTGTPRVIHHLVEQELRPFRTVGTQHGVDRLDPLTRLFRIEIIGQDARID
jgi:hypothetical protein